MPKANKKIIVVLGMHRSGTSAVARGLQVLHVELGDHLMPPNSANVKGFWEDIDLNALNVEMMKAINNEWHHLAPIGPTDVEILRRAGFFPRAQKMLRAKVKGNKPFGFKDPRTAKLLPFWNEVFERYKYDASYVLVARHPLSIVRSLAKRDGFEAEKSYLLWLVHMLESLSVTSGHRRVLVDYDLLMQNPGRELQRMAEALHLTADPVELAVYKAEFIDESLRHSMFDQNELESDPACPPLVRDVYGAMVEIASDRMTIDARKFKRNIAKWTEEFSRIGSALSLADKHYAIDRFHAALYLATETQAFSEGRRVSLSIRIDQLETQSIHVYEILPGVCRLRLDPCDGFDVIHLQFLEFLDSDGKLLRRWDGVPDSEVSLHLTIMEMRANTGWALVCPIDDPWIEFLLPLGTNSVRLAMRRVEAKSLAELLAEKSSLAISARGMTQEVRQRDEQIETLLQSIGECDLKIAGLSQGILERDAGLASASQALAVSVARAEVLYGHEQTLGAQLAESRAESAKAQQSLFDVVQSKNANARNYSVREQTLNSQLADLRHMIDQVQKELLIAARATAAREVEFASQLTARGNALGAQLSELRAETVQARQALLFASRASVTRELKFGESLAAQELTFGNHLSELRTELDQVTQALVAAGQLSVAREQEFSKILAAREDAHAGAQEQLRIGSEHVQKTLLAASQVAAESEKTAILENASLEVAHARELAAKYSDFAAQTSIRETEFGIQLQAVRVEGDQARQALLAATQALVLREREFAMQLAERERVLESRLVAVSTDAAQVTSHLQSQLTKSQQELTVVRESLWWRLGTPFRSIVGGLGKDAKCGDGADAISKVVPNQSTLAPTTIASNDQRDALNLIVPERNEMLGKNGNLNFMSMPTLAQPLHVAELLKKDGIEFLESAYMALVERSSDQRGRAYYLERMESGVNKTQVLYEIFGSAECQAKSKQLLGLREALASAGLDVPDSVFLPAFAEDANSIVSAEDLLQYDGERLIEHSYLVLLGRPPDAEGLQHYLGRLNSGVTKSQVLYEIFTSAECRESGTGLKGIREAYLRENGSRNPAGAAMAASHRASVATSAAMLMTLNGGQFVECAYLTLLRRPPDAEGFQKMLARLHSGVAKIQILADIAASNEARVAGVSVRGLSWAITCHQLAKIPLIGFAMRQFFKVDGSATFESRIRSIEQQIGANHQSVIARLDSAIQSMARAQQMKQVGSHIDLRMHQLSRAIATHGEKADTHFDRLELQLSTLQVVSVNKAHDNPTSGANNVAYFTNEDLPIADGKWEWSQYSVVKERIQSAKAARQENHKPLRLNLIDIGLENPSTVAKRIFLPPPGKSPDVSIILPVFNNLKLTLECLLSITEHSDLAITFEVLLRDDASTDDTVKILSAIKNLRLIRNPENLGFLLNCNRALDSVRGKYVLFLNNDVQVTKDWLKNLIDTFSQYPDVGAVGPRFVYPSGHLQEAGAAFLPDGTSEMIGLNDDPALPRYSYVRRVDYTSGACLMLPTVLAKELGGFSEEFLPCYCEDSDLCLRVQAKGYFVYYNPAVTIVHHLSKTTASVDNEFKYRCVSNNLTKLARKWSAHFDKTSIPRVLAFYLPQFHPFAENNAWWGEGFTEWTNVAKAKPNFVGHYQPRLPADLGYYDLRLPEIMEQQAELARANGIDGFCFYYYWFGGKRLLELPLEKMLESKRPDFPFCLCWANENWSRRWDGQDSEILMAQAHSPQDDLAVIADLSRYFRDARYIRIDGRPLILVYRVPLFPDFAKTADRWRIHCRNEGIGEIYIAMVESFQLVHSQTHPSLYGCDAAVEFPPQELGEQTAPSGAIINSEFKGVTCDYEDLAIRFAGRNFPPYTRFKGVAPGWDNTARMQDKSYCFENATPGVFQAWLEESLDQTRAQHFGDERLVFVNAWNEWAEGTYLEPDGRFGHSFLNAVRNAKDAVRLLRKLKYGLGE